MTVTVPLLPPAGVVAVIVVLFTTTMFVAAVPPNVTVAPVAKFVPVIVTAVPPLVVHCSGALLSVGTTTYVNAWSDFRLAGDRDRHRHCSGLPAGVVAVIGCLSTTTTFVAAVPPNLTVAPAAKFVPMIVTAVPPIVVPLFGDTLLTVEEKHT